MRKSRFSAEQISTALRQVESGVPVAEVTRKLGVSEKTYYLWKKQYAHLLTNELRELSSSASRYSASARATASRTDPITGNTDDSAGCRTQSGRSPRLGPEK